MAQLNPGQLQILTCALLQLQLVSGDVIAMRGWHTALLVLSAVDAAVGRAPLGLESRPKPRTLDDARDLHRDAMRATARRMGRCGRAPTTRQGSHAAACASGGSVATPISPINYGADPTGKTDSTAAFEAAVAALTNTSARAAVPMASGIANLGGATLDLAGGEYVIAKPVAIPPFLGNVRIRGGTLRAAPSFPPDRFLIEVGDPNCVPKDNQKVCNEFVAVEDIFLDASHVAAGGVRVALTMGTTVGPSAFVTGFNQAGVLVVAGHETMVLDAWIAEYYWSEHRPPSKACDPASGEGSIGVHIMGEDNYVQNTIVFDFTCLGVLVNGAASLLDGVHSWNGGGVAILLNGSYEVQDRVLGCYLDYSVLQIVNPNMITVQDSFFYNSHAVLTGDNVRNLVMRENTYSMNQDGGNRSVVLTNPSAACDRVVVADDINGQQGGGAPHILATQSRKSLHQSGATQWVFDFGDALLFGSVGTVTYSITLDKGEPLVMHAALPPDGMSVTVTTSKAVSATVTVEAIQCT